ncbi:hypothetical protein JHK86_012329 [Glycine max]|nr:hypothetical protein JHK86_012329 [Glycine max]
MLQKEVSTKSTYAEAQSYNEDMKLTSNPTPTMAARLAVKHTSGHHEFPNPCSRNQKRNRSLDTHIVVGRTHRTPYTAGKPILSSLEPTEPPTMLENPYCRHWNPTEPTLSWLEENPTYTVATTVLKHSSLLKGQSFLREREVEGVLESAIGLAAPLVLIRSH